jgi:transposase-like protein
MKFNGVKALFELHLKECEWRYNKALPQLRSEPFCLCRRIIS